MSLQYKQGEGGGGANILRQAASVLKLNGASGTRTAEGRPAPQQWPRSARLVLSGRRSGTGGSVRGFVFLGGDNRIRVKEQKKWATYSLDETELNWHHHSWDALNSGGSDFKVSLRTHLWLESTSLIIHAQVKHASFLF